VLNKFSIAAKVSLIPVIAIGSFLVFLGLTAGIGSNNAKLLEHVHEKGFPILRASDRISAGTTRLDDVFKTAVTTGDSEPLEQAEKIYFAISADLVSINQLDSSLGPEATDLQKKLDGYYKMAKTLVTALVEGTVDYSVLAERSAQMNKAYTDLVDKISGFQSVRLEAFKDSFSKVDESAASLVQYGIVMGVISIAVTLVVAVFVVWGLKKNLLSVVHSLKSIADEGGDLTLRLTAKSNDEVGDLVFWFNSLMDKLHDVIKNVVNTSQPLVSISNTLVEVAEHANGSLEHCNQY